MKLRNKKTGEIGLVHCDATMFSDKIGVFIDNNHIDLRNPYKIYNSLAELNEEWEDYEEPKGVKEIYVTGATVHIAIHNQKEAIEVEEKLKALKRLQGAGFRFEGYSDMDRSSAGHFDIYAYVDTNNNLIEDAQPKLVKDLDLLFGGKE